MIKLNQKGALDPLMMIPLVIVLALGGYVAYIFLGGNYTDETVQQTLQTDDADEQEEIAENKELIDTPCYTIELPKERYAEPSVSACGLVAKTFDAGFSDMKISPIADSSYEDAVQDLLKLFQEAVDKQLADEPNDSINRIIKDKGLPKVSYTTVDGFEAAVVDAVNIEWDLEIRMVVINTDQEYVDSDSGDILKTFLALGYYYNNALRTQFEENLNTLKFKPSNIE